MKFDKRSHCKHLRSKKAYVPDCNDVESWRSAESSTQQFWCLCTMTTAGPDNKLVAPETCSQERACYENVEF